MLKKKEEKEDVGHGDGHSDWALDETKAAEEKEKIEESENTTDVH